MTVSTLSSLNLYVLGTLGIHMMTTVVTSVAKLFHIVETDSPLGTSA